jgi:hypothetical protein
MIKSNLLIDIIEYERLIIDNPYNGTDYLVIKWCGVKFLKDFGPWRAGEKAYDLVFDLIEGRLIQYNSFGDDIKFCEIGLVVKEASKMEKSKS